MTRESFPAGVVLVGGAINTDLVARLRVAPASGETVTGSAFNIFGGGKGANQATAAARAGAVTAMLGAVGDDEFGRQRLADLSADGIATDSVATTDTAASGVALITVEETTGQNRIAYVPGATLSVTAEQAVAALAAVQPAILLTTLELPLPALDALFTAANERGLQILLNATPEPVSGRFLLDRTDLLIVNETEAADLLGQNVAPDAAVDAARTLLELGPRGVVITLGAAGAVLVTTDQELRLPAPAVDVVDTTGAGDTFCGALAASVAQGRPLAEAAAFGVIAGSLATTRHGAQPSIPHQAEVEALYSREARR